MKKTNIKRVSAKGSKVFRTRLMAIAVSSCFSGAAYSLGVNPTVVAGSATVSQNGNVMTVTNSNGTIINWGALSVLGGEKLIFDQAANSSVLNRVIGMNVNGKWVIDPTVIAGTISSKGSVWIINSAGIMAKQGSVIDVGHLVASTLDINNANFLAGKLQFNATPGAGAVTVEKGASISTSTGGSVYLIGSNVSNSGLISTPEGETILAAGQSVSLVDTGTPGVKVEITGNEGNVTNLGTILAEAGRIGLAGALVRNSGALNASSVVKEGGRIFLKASRDAYVDGDGRIVTTGTKGGRVEVLGNRVAVMDHASIDASGTNGGGTVLVGGDYQGKNAAVQNSSATYFGKEAVIKADATGNGNGGKVIVWADQATRAEGTISARGGALGGNGGLVEVSGKQHLDFNAHVDVRAPHGTTGRLVLDPDNVEIVSGTIDTSTSDVNGAPWAFVMDVGNNPSQIGWGNITSQLGSANVYVMGNNLTISNGVTYASTNGLNLLAAGSIYATNVNVTNTSSGAINFYAGWDSTVVPSTSSSIPVMQAACGSCDIIIQGSTIRTAGSMNWKALGKIEISGGSAVNQSSLVQAGSQTFTAGMISVYGGALDGTSATLESLGNQSLTANHIGVYGGGTGGASNAFGLIRAHGAQQLTLTGSGAALELIGGGYSGYASSNNSARIEQTSATGSQTITFDSTGGSITLTGGNDNGGVGAGNNGAKIDGGMGTQTIGNSSFRPDIAVYGGDSGGTWDRGNEASIGLQDGNAGTQTVYAGNIDIVGGNADYGGAGFSGAHQRFYLSGDLNMTGGASTQLDSDNIPGSMAYIGNKYGGDIQLNVGGAVTLQGGTGSPVMIGSLYNSANVTISSGVGRNVTISTDGAGVLIGSRQELASGANDLFSPDVMLGSNTRILSGGNVSITSGGNVGLGYVKAALGAGYGATIEANYSILDNNGTGLNVEADSITLRSGWGGTISADTKATNTLSADVGVACEVCTAPSGGISIRNWSTSPSAVYLTDRSLSGNISFFNQASLTGSGSVHASADNGDLLISTAGSLDLGVLAPGSVNANSVILAAGSNITGSASYSAVDASNVAADLTLVAGGNIALSGSTVTGSQVNLVAGNSVALTNSSVQATSSDLNVIAPTISLDNSKLLAYGNLNMVANNIVAQNQSVLAAGVAGQAASAWAVSNPYGDVTMTVTGDIVLNNGVMVESGNDTILNLQGPTSTLYLNKTAGLNASKIISDIATGVPATTHLNFLLNTGGGVVIDGANTATTTAGGSGFYVLNSSTPATEGKGLSVMYLGAATTGDAGDASKSTTTTLTKTTTDSNLTDETSSNTTLILKPIAPTGGNGATTGGDEGTFGGEDKEGSKSNGSESNDKKEQSNGKSTSQNKCS